MAETQTLQATEETTGDQIDRTATQVRLDDDVHVLVGHWWSADAGHVYQTQCGDEVRATAGAALTTFPACCPACNGWPL